MNPPIITRNQMIDKLEAKAHPLDSSITREAVSLGDLTGLSKIGLHYTVLKSGHVSTVQHSHQFSDEFLLILKGCGELLLNDHAFPLSEGDFVGLAARGPSHALKNIGSDDLVYVVGGDRPQFDICHYPARNERAYLYFDSSQRTRDFVANDSIDSK